MKAVVFNQHGGVEVLKTLGIPEPEPQAGEVWVRICACALNRLDIWVRQGLPGNPSIPMPHIGGCDISGVVEKIGPSVSEPALKEGMPVLIASGVSRGDCLFCRMDRTLFAPGSTSWASSARGAWLKK